MIVFFRRREERKEPDLRDLLDSRLLQFAYRTSVGIVQIVYRMAFAVMVAVLLFIAIVSVLSWL